MSIPIPHIPMAKPWLHAGVLTLAVAWPVLSQAVTVTLKPVADATIFNFDGCSDGTPGSECGAGTGDRLYVGFTGGYGERRSLLRFDLSGIPAGAVITSASLQMRLVKAHAQSSNVSVRRVMQAWSEGPTNFSQGPGVAASPGDVTWTQRSYRSTPAQPWTTPGGDYAATVSSQIVVPGTSGAYVWSGAQMTADVQAWLDQPATNFGWGLQGTGSAEAYGSREHFNADLRPQLSINYTVPAPVADSSDAPLPAWALGTLGLGLLGAIKRRGRMRPRRLP